MALVPEIEEIIGKKAFQADFSEVNGLDNLQSPDDCIAKSLSRTAEIYGSGRSFYLVNSASSGIAAIMLASVKPGEKVLIARNAHKSVIDALVLSGAVPVWVNTEWDKFWNIPDQLNPEKIAHMLDKIPDIKALWLTNPTYEGILSDVERIAGICSKKNIILVVDEAHGALWNFNDRLPVPAIHLGADASVQSLHKTASSLTQTAILHLSPSSKIDPDKVQNSLNLLNTSSPSYLLLASIEGTIHYLHSAAGRKKLDELLNNADYFRDKLSKYSDILYIDDDSYFQTDKTKLLLGISYMSGHKLHNILEAKYNIETEMVNNKGILALTGIGTSREKLDRLSNALINIERTGNDNEKNYLTPLLEPIMAIPPRLAFYKDSVMIPPEESIGQISKDTIVPYPPGIPVLIAGEIIQDEHIKFLADYKQIAVVK